MISTSRESPDANAEALATLAEYLELLLDKGKSLILVRSQAESSDVFLGDASEPEEDWTRHGKIRNAMASAVLGLTRSGFNELTIGGQTYRFVRAFTEVSHQGAVVFSAA
ncbi:MAG: hypothetical protein LBV73_02850 [Paraburkholderia sp.]|jgi:hypothetical protein|nr:hypothetical protein [Paraburkholderia sp.]